ncbi:hypothetical protein HPB49_006236 [Dermacentor silvarum]|uniref:Uncharacterized protein n=1 Tax=Dermacentor silvarum TaxID=543639 RepID=A0ACB8CQ16_DERSI|nr:hypothetical protein HPB49_006236 [Dermacentor silvarum]
MDRGCIIGCCMCPGCRKSPVPAPPRDNDREIITFPEQIEENPAPANFTTLCEDHFTVNQCEPLTLHNCDAKCSATPSVFRHMAQEQGFDRVCANPGRSLLKRHQASNLQQDGQPVTCSMSTTSIAGYLGSDQALYLQKGTMRGTAWSTETVVNALKLKLSCRSQGYNVARELEMPLPSE